MVRLLGLPADVKGVFEEHVYIRKPDPLCIHYLRNQQVQTVHWDWHVKGLKIAAKEIHRLKSLSGGCALILFYTLLCGRDCLLNVKHE